MPKPASEETVAAVLQGDDRQLPGGDLVLPISMAMRAEIQRLTETGLWGRTPEETAREVLARGLRETRERYPVPW